MTLDTTRLLLVAAALVGASPGVLEAGRDDARIVVTGVVGMLGDDRFRLDTGEGPITVEMHDRERGADALPIGLGERVTVTGRVDDDVFERRRVVADAVYAFGKGALYRSREVEAHAAAPTDPLPQGTPIQLYGTVSEVFGSGFLVRTGGLPPIRVITDRLPSDPLDDVGAPRIGPGDRVSVAGFVDDPDFFETSEVHAERIEVLEHVPARRGD